MSSLFAGRPTLVSLLLASLTLFLFIGLSSSHPQSRLHRHNVAHALQQREVTSTLTVFTTDSVTVSEFVAFSSRSRHHHRSTPVSSPSSSPSFSSEALASSSPASSFPLVSSLPLFSPSAESSPSSSSHATSRTFQDSRTPTPTSSSFAGTTVPRSSTQVLVPSPLLTVPATTLSIADELPTLTSPLPTSAAQIAPPPPPSASSEGTTGTGFWSNKGAVGGVFTVVGLVIVGIVSFFLITYIRRTKKNRSRRYDEVLFNGYFDREHSRHGSSPGSHSLNYPAMDPFAAGEVVQVPGSAASLHRGIGGGMMSGPSSPSSKFGHGGHNSDDGTSSHGHSSSMHHGFSSISYHTGFSEARANYAGPESPLLSQLPKSVPPPFSPPEYHPEDPFSNAAAVPLSAGIMSTYTAPSPFLGAGRVNNHRETDSDASYYADQIHSYYYGAGASAPSPRSFGQAF